MDIQQLWGIVVQCTRGIVAIVVAGMLFVLSASAMITSVQVVSAGSPPIENPVIVTKGIGGPRASAETRSFFTMNYGVWYSWVENSGLRTLTIDIYDNTSGSLEEVSHARVRFASQNAYPSGRVDLPPLTMARYRTYEFVFTPNGPNGGQASYYHEFDPFIAPVVTFTYTVQDLLVTVDGGLSNDPDGTVVSWDWDWGDGSPHGSGMIAQHEYGFSGTYTITLVITDNDGLTSETSRIVTVTSPATNREVFWTISNMFELRKKEWGLLDPEMLGHWGNEMGMNSYLMVREPNYGEIVLRDSYPFMQAFNPYSTMTTPDTDAGFLVTSWYRMYTSARNIEELGTGPGKDPIFIPIFGNPALDGGSVDIRWYMTYLTTDELRQIRLGTHYANTYYGVPPYKTPTSDDGYWNELHGRMWLDRSAAVKFLGLPGIGDLREEFSAQRLSIDAMWLNDWIAEGSHGGRYDIYTAYDFANDVRWVEITLDPESTPDALVLRFWTISWGNEVLMMRYLEGANVSPNWNAWPDDLYLNISMRSGQGELFSRAVMGYHLTAWKDLEHFSGAWSLESNDLDSSGNDPYHNSYPSKFNEYDPDQTDATRRSWAPGTVNYGNRISYWCAPTEFDLSAGERLVINLPSNDTPVIGIEPYRGSSDALDGAKKAELTGKMYWGELVMGNGWPNATTGPDLKGFYNPEAKTLVIQGPVDFPRYPNPVYPNLMETGAPTFLFDVSRASSYDVVLEGIPGPMPGENTISVTARSIAGDVVTSWNSTVLVTIVHTHNDVTEVMLIEHAYTPAEAGVFTFTVTLDLGSWLFLAEDLIYWPDVAGVLGFELLPAG